MYENDYDISSQEGVSCMLPDEDLARAMDLVLREEGVERPCMVSVSIVSDERMRELNLEWRQQDRSTDVLSLECERPDDPGLSEGEPCELGDIVLAPAYIARQAAGFGTTPADECRLLVIHGMLHLLGYDHLQDDEAELMEAREDELLSLLGTDATIDHVALTRHRKGDVR